MRGAAALRLTTTGRRSGSPHAVELWFAYADGVVYLLAHPGPAGKGTDWFRNLRARPDCGLQAGTWRGTGRARPARDPASLERQARKLFEAKYGRSAYEAWYAGSPRLPIAIQIEPPGSIPSGGMKSP